MRVGILGGTFDPPHPGHFALAQAAIEALNLDEVMMLPVHRNPLKNSKRQTPGKQRMEMLKLAVQGETRRRAPLESKLAISDIELVRGGPSYAVETLQELSHVRHDEYWFLLGSDALREIEQWKSPEKLVRLCRLGVVLRKGQDKSQLLATLPDYVKEAVDWIEMPAIDVSSTKIRQRVLERRSNWHWLDPEVIRYIEEHKLYRS